MFKWYSKSGFRIVSIAHWFFFLFVIFLVRQDRSYIMYLWRARGRMCLADIQLQGASQTKGHSYWAPKSIVVFALMPCLPLAAPANDWSRRGTKAGRFLKATRLLTADFGLRTACQPRWTFQRLHDSLGCSRPLPCPLAFPWVKPTLQPIGRSPSLAYVSPFLS